MVADLDLPNDAIYGHNVKCMDVTIYADFPLFFQIYYEFLEEGGEFQPQERTSTYLSASG